MDAATLDGPNGFVRAVDAEARAQSPRARTGVVFVHGFNTNFAEALMKDVQLRHDPQSPGAGVMFTWPSEAKLMAYVAGRENALFSRDALADTLGLMQRASLRGYNLVAHSMGTFLAMETLRTLALTGDRATLSRINAVVLISADLEIDLLRRQAPPVLAAGVPIYLLRSAAELGGLDVGVVDLGAIGSDDAARHLKVGSSPEVIALVQRIRNSGVSIFDDGQKTGLLDGSAAILQGATGAILRPF